MRTMIYNIYIKGAQCFSAWNNEMIQTP